MSHWNLHRLSAVAAILLFVIAPSWAQPPGGGRPGGGPGGPGGFGGFGRERFGSPLALVGQEVVQKELKLSEEQVEKAKKVADESAAEMRKEMEGVFGDIGELPPEERRAKMEAGREKMQAAMKKLQEKYRPKLAEVLDKPQMERVVQIARQAQGVAALQDESVAKDLSLSKDQTEKLKKVEAERREKLSGLSFEDMRSKGREIRETYDTQALAVLTPDQTKKFDELKGKPFDFDQLRGPGGPGGRGGDGPGRAGNRPPRPGN